MKRLITLLEKNLDIDTKPRELLPRIKDIKLTNFTLIWKSYKRYIILRNSFHQDHCRGYSECFWQRPEKWLCGEGKNKTEYLLQRSGCPRIKLVLIERLVIEELPRASICNNPEKVAMANQVTIASVMLHGNGQARLIRCAGAVHFLSKMADEAFLSLAYRFFRFHSLCS